MSLTTRWRSVAAVLATVTALVAIPAAASAAPLTTVPFGPASPFNLLVPPNAPIASNGGSLGASVGLSYAEYTPAVYVSSPSDPEYTIRLTSGWGPNALDGKKVRINPAARRANEDDGHLVIVVPQENLVISLYQAAQGPSGSTWSASWGGMAPLDGTGANRRDSPGGRESGISQLAGLITPDDVRRGIAEGPNGDLGHALAMLHPTISNRTYVPPAISAGGNSSSGLYMGQRVFLDPTVNVDSLRWQGSAVTQRFGKLVARTLQRYGAIVVTNSSGNGFQMLNPLSYTSIGQPNPWPALVGPDAEGYFGYAVSAIPGNRMRAMDPSGGSGVPRPAALPVPPGAAPAPANPLAATPAPKPAGVTWARLLVRRVVRSANQVHVVVKVRSTRAGTLSVGAKKLGTKKLARGKARLRAGKVTTLIVRLPAKAGTRPKVALVVSVADARGAKHTLRRATFKVAAAPR